MIASISVERIAPDRRGTWEAELDGAGVPLPLGVRAAGQVSVLGHEWACLGVRDAAGQPIGMVSLTARRVRAVPGHVVVRAERFGAGMSSDVIPDVVSAVLGMLRGAPRVLRFSAALFSPDPDDRERKRQALVQAGFTEASEREGYRHTLRLDLAPSETDLMAGFHRSARRNIRELDKGPAVLAPITNVALVPRMESMLEATLKRTGGHYARQDWARRIVAAGEFPDLFHLRGVFRADADGLAPQDDPDALLAFALGCWHGDHAQYAESAAVRVTDFRLAAAYPLVWDLILWARRRGAGWFDLGGVTPGTASDEDPLGGISDFKRFFSSDLVEVGEEWVWTPATARARLARFGYDRLRRWRGRGTAGPGAPA